MSHDNPLVSIVIPTYNSAHFLARTLDSCLAQTYAPCEIIVVDDGSTDGTRRLIESNYEGDVVYLSQANAGAAAARNKGIQAAQGDYIQFCDADDILLPDKIMRCMAVFQQAAPDNLAVVYTRYQHVQADGVTPVRGMSDPPLLSGDIFCDLLGSNSNAILTSATLVRRDALLDVGLFRVDERLRNAEDWDLFLRLANRYRYAAVNDILVRYRWHEGGLTHDPYYAALGRLVAVQHARHYERRSDCYDDAAYDRVEAGRYHTYAMASWQRGKRAEARQALTQAIRLAPEQATLRRLYRFLAYIAPVGVAYWIDRQLSKAQP